MMLEVTFLAADFAPAFSCPVFGARTVETEPLLGKEFLSFVHGDYACAITRGVVDIFTIDTRAAFPVFVIHGVVKL